MKQVLTERFHLKFHTEDRPLPGYVITIAKGGAKLTESKQPSDSPNCRGIQDKDTTRRVWDQLHLDDDGTVCQQLRWDLYP